MTVSNNSASPAYQGPGSATRSGPSDEARQSKAAKSEQRLTMSVMGLLGIRMLMDHKFHEHVIVLAIGVAAVAVLARERQTKMLVRLVAWDKHQEARFLHKAKKN